MLSLFFFLAVFSCVMSYINLDPMKSCFFLIFSLIMAMPLISFFLHVWFSYFICLLFLSGIFVILVYFSSLSKVSFINTPLSLLGGVLSVFLFYPFFYGVVNFVSISVFFYSVYWMVFIWIIMVLVFFMNFTSYYLNFSGALRKL
uniref:NADH dehydrogenase subunit 6 n=3 Tax=Contracaecum TaxID=47567 RepID=A0A1D8KW86_9BILA|nr:NADH dehydrogenase subunit 6 [Contracaecum ogmorhini sensu lato Australia]YP_009312586.1 NADH dehydrogenase subunit 6 [Contracaecum ogmorhini sensu lato South Africa]YP_009312598.1 NADH dehydrogenase subunit 6 [Contracaecum ogmorhini sensu lato Pacific Canada]AOV63336.1 NADH dehydrogenase subunit 6 [Contracaecum ogmorhini sensu lato Australia]AOV63348.1 NADH dehydrogenase subunit 6 [Contracaecum ogmorhini sensu lato South Africa]AOV63360.1 NADH dehydrogenase subunit 6 [Contracaecum ogmorhin